MACVKRETGFSDSGRSLPRIKISIRTGTRVMDKIDEMLMDRVLVQVSGLNMRPSWASSRKTGRKETTMITSEKKSAGPTSLAPAIRMRRRSRAVTSGGGVAPDSSRLWALLKSLLRPDEAAEGDNWRSERSE